MADSRPARELLIGTALLIGALVLLLISKTAFQQKHILADFGLGAGQYGTGITFPEIIEVPAGALPLRVVCQAPVNQSWVYLDCRLLNPSGGEISRFHISLANYHGIKDGRKWKTGGQSTAKTVSIEAGGPLYLQVTAFSGVGSDAAIQSGGAGPPVRISIQSGMRTVRWMTWSTALLAIAGIAMMMRAALPRSPESTTPAEVSKPRFVFLDGLRGVAVLAVLICHFFLSETSSLAGILDQAFPVIWCEIARHGALGVEVFFVLSGFVIAHTLSGREITRRYAGRFIVRRAIRLDPPYYIALGIMLTIVAADESNGFFDAWKDYGGTQAAAGNLFYLQDILKLKSPLGVAWSLCLEIQFYLSLIVFCALSGGIARWRQSTRESALLSWVIPLILMSLAVWYPALSRYDFFGTWFRFGLGVLTYLAFRRQVRLTWWMMVMALILGLSIVFKDPRGATAAGTAAAILAAGNRGKMGSWLSNRPIQFFGRISYSLYLIHLAAGVGLSNVLWGLVDQKPANARLLVGLGLVTSVAGSLLLYRVFEKPGIAISQRLK